MQRATRAPVAGESLLHPAAIAAVLTLVANDHYLKHAAPGVVTGKLSDVAGLVFFPLLLQAGWEMSQVLIGRRWRPSLRVLSLCVVATGVVFAAVQVVPGAADAYRVALGWLRWPLEALLAVASGRELPAQFRVRHTPDLTDLLALPALAVPWWVGRRRAVLSSPV